MPNINVNLKPPAQRRGIAGDAEAGFLTLSLIAIAGLAVLNVEPFTGLLKFVTTTVQDFANLANPKR